MTAPTALPDLGAYRRFIVAFSGGKDSLAALLHLLSLGVPAHAIELPHRSCGDRREGYGQWLTACPSSRPGGPASIPPP